MLYLLCLPPENLWLRKLGTGVVLFPNTWRCRAFFLLALLATVQFIIFENAGALNEDWKPREGYLSLGVLTMEIWARVKFCARESARRDIKLFCNEGQVIGGFKRHVWATRWLCMSQRGSDEEVLYGASLPPDLTSPTKCAADYLNGLLKSTNERCRSSSATSTGTVISKTWIFEVKMNAAATYAYGNVAHSWKYGRIMRRWCQQCNANGPWDDVDIVFNACNGNEKCEVLVDDYTSGTL